MKHGTRTAYNHGGCRCTPCRLANTEYRQRWRAAARLRTTPSGLHGTLTGYSQWSCRCRPCTNAMLVAEGRPIPPDATDAAGAGERTAGTVNP